MQTLGNYDVVVAGAGVTGVVTAIASSREGARTLLLDASGMLGGLITGGRLTKPQGVVQPGIYLELLLRAERLGGAKPDIRLAEFAAHSGIFDSETMQRAVVEMIDESGVDVLLFSQVMDVVRDGEAVTGLQLLTKAGPAVVFGSVVVDTTGDGDVAALAGADYMLGREEDGLLQPMTSYFRIVNVDMDALAKDASESRDDLYSLELPEDWSEDGVDSDYSMVFYMRGLEQRIAGARAAGFDWILPQSMLVMKAGLLPGEINVNATRVHGSGLDPWDRSRAVIELRKQAYCVMDFLREFVRGFERAVILDVSPVLGVRETRRVKGEYVLTATDVRGEARFDDSIGLCINPVDIHEPGGESMIIEPTGDGYGIPFRCLIPEGVEGLLVAGRCISVDHIAFGSTRQTPGCALTGQAAGVAAALAAKSGVSPGKVDVSAVQSSLRDIGTVLGVERSDGFDTVVDAVAERSAALGLLHSS